MATNGRPKKVTGKKVRDVSKERAKPPASGNGGRSGGGGKKKGCGSKVLVLAASAMLGAIVLARRIISSI